MALIRSDVMFKVYGAKCVGNQKVKLRPMEHHYKREDEPEYIKYGCQLCENLAKSYPNEIMYTKKQFKSFSFEWRTEQYVLYCISRRRINETVT